MVSAKVLEGFDAMFILLTSVYLIYTLTVSPENTTWALIYISMTVIYFIALILSKMPSFKEWVDVVTYTEKPLPFKKSIVAMFAAVLFVALIIYAGQTGFMVVDAPVFAASPGTGAEFEPIRTGIAGLIEGRFFICFIFFTFIRIFKKYVNPMFASVGAALAGSGVFLSYHFFVYGSQSLTLQRVFMFGLMSILIQFMSGLVFVIDAIHAGNNIGVTIARMATISVYVYLQTLAPFIVFGVVVALLWKRFG